MIAISPVKNMHVSIVLMLGAVLVLGCSSASSGEVGESCAVPGDCTSGNCIVGGSFPDGVCTLACDKDSDCPGGFSCISRSSGICLRRCTDTGECQSERGAAWQCREESLEDGGGNQLVCIGN